MKDSMKEDIGLQYPVFKRRFYENSSFDPPKYNLDEILGKKISPVYHIPDKPRSILHAGSITDAYLGESDVLPMRFGLNVTVHIPIFRNAFGFPLEGKAKDVKGTYATMEAARELMKEFKVARVEELVGQDCYVQVEGRENILSIRPHIYTTRPLPKV